MTSETTNEIVAQGERPDYFADIKGMDYASLLEAKTANLYRLDMCKAQVARAQGELAETGLYADRDWWGRVHGAIRVFGKVDQAIGSRLAQLKRERSLLIQQEREEQATRKKRVLTLPQHFMNVASETLDADMFRYIQDLAFERSTREPPGDGTGL